MKIPYPRKNGKSTLCINDDIVKLKEYIENGWSGWNTFPKELLYVAW